MIKILVVVRGGLVEEVRASGHPVAEVSVLDLDDRPNARALALYNETAKDYPIPVTERSITDEKEAEEAATLGGSDSK